MTQCCDQEFFHSTDCPRRDRTRLAHRKARLEPGPRRPRREAPDDSPAIPVAEDPAAVWARVLADEDPGHAYLRHVVMSDDPRAEVRRLLRALPAAHAARVMPLIRAEAALFQG